MGNELTVYVIDDDEAMRNSLDFLLVAAGFSVRVFNSAASFLDVLPGIHSGCLITDIRMPGIDGLELLRRVKCERPTLSVVIMTGQGDMALAIEAMKLGASDFIEKPFEEQRVIDAISAATTSVTGAEETFSTEIISRVATLGTRERQVLDDLVTGLSNKAIASNHGFSSQAVDIYRANIMTKMRAVNLSDLVQLAVRAGLSS